MTIALRVAYVIWTYPKASETFVSSEVRAVRGIGHVAQVFAGRPEQATFTPAPGSGNPPAQYPPRWPRIAEILGGLPQLAFAARLAGDLPEFVTSWWLAVRLKRQVARFSPDVIHSHFANHPTLTALILGRWLNRPVTAMFHANDYLVAVPPRALAERAQRLDQVCVISVAAAAEVAARTGLDPARISLVRAALDPDLLARAPAPRSGSRIVVVARLVPKKGHRQLIDGFAELVRRGDPGAELLLIGDGPERATLAARVAELGLADRVTLAGAMPHAATVELVWTARVAALTAVVTTDGDADGIPVFLMEAAAAGLPIVSTPVGGVPELIADGDGGRLLAELSPAVVADALAAALGPAGEHWGQTARARVVAEFDPQRQAQRLQQLWGSVLAGRARHHRPGRKPAGWDG